MMQRIKDRTGVILGGFRKPTFYDGNSGEGAIRFWYGDNEPKNIINQLSAKSANFLYWCTQTVEGYINLVAEISSDSGAFCEIENTDDMKEGTCEFTPSSIMKDKSIDIKDRLILAAFMHPSALQDVTREDIGDQFPIFEKILKRKGLIAIRRDTALGFLEADSDEYSDDEDISDMSDEELFDWFVEAGYMQDQEALYPQFYEGACPEDCLDAEVCGEVTGWPTELSTYYVISKK